MDRVKGKVAVVTGGASGIGEASARLLAREGASVAVTDIADQNGKRVVDEIIKAGGTAAYWHMDVTREKEVDQTFAEIYQKYGRLDILVNSAGIPGYPKPTHETTTAEWDRVIDINLKGTFFCVRAAVPYILKGGAGGSVVNISSMLGLIGGEDPVYHASKGGVRLMTKSDATIYARDRIRFNSVHPGYIMTPLFRGFSERVADKAAFFREFEEKIPMGRIGTPEDVANGVLFLASDESSYITGSELVIDGAMSIV